MCEIQEQGRREVQEVFPELCEYRTAGKHTDAETKNPSNIVVEKGVVCRIIIHDLVSKDEYESEICH